MASNQTPRSLERREASSWDRPVPARASRSRLRRLRWRLRRLARSAGWMLAPAAMVAAFLGAACLLLLVGGRAGTLPLAGAAAGLAGVAYLYRSAVTADAAIMPARAHHRNAAAPDPHRCRFCGRVRGVSAEPIGGTDTVICAWCAMGAVQHLHRHRRR